MKIICAGMGKTGTKSITKALRHLGFTVFDAEEQIFDFLDHWVDVLQNGVPLDAKRVYQDADALNDIPGNFFWEEILQAFPDCKVILSERDEDSWVKSMVRQLEAVTAAKSRIMSMLSPTMKKMYFVGDSLIDALVGTHNKRSICVLRKCYRLHQDHVKSVVTPDKLLVYNVKQGWKPLCDFLGCEVPEVVFPHENINAEVVQKLVSLEMTRFGRQVKRELWRAVFVITTVFVAIVASFFICYFS